LTSIERRIVDAIARIKAEGMEPRAIYLTPDDRDQLGAGVTEAGGLPIRPISGKGKSTVYTTRGLSRQLATPDGLRRRKPLTAKPKPKLTRKP
jgi:hypothetical protein